MQGVHAGLPLGHIRQRADGDDEQLRVFGVGVGPGPDLGPAGEVVGGVEEVQGLGFGLALVDVDVDDLFRQPLGDEGIPGVRADVPRAQNHDLSVLQFHGAGSFLLVGVSSRHGHRQIR